MFIQNYPYILCLLLQSLYFFTMKIYFLTVCTFLLLPCFYCQFDIIRHWQYVTVYFFRTCFIFRHPKSFGIYKALVMPFSPAVWMCTGALCVLIVSALRLIHRFEVTDWPDTELSWSASTVLVIGAISQQGRQPSFMHELSNSVSKIVKLF